jgi:polyhydroxyalkanoate synthesis regulator phasin
MATTKKSTRKPARKTAKKGKSQFHAVKAIKETKDNWIETAKDYNEKYVLKPFETGMDFVGEMQKDPLKTIEGLVDDGKDFVRNVRKNPRKVFNGFVENGKDFVEELRDDFRSVMDDFIDGGKGLYKGLQKDTRKAFEGIVDKGKNLTDKIPMVNTIEDGIAKGLKSVPDRLNLPNKKDMETLAKTVKALNRKINTLSKAQTA